MTARRTSPSPLTGEGAEREKREALVDRLIGSADYIEHWTNKWADLLEVNRKFLGEQGAAKFRTYIRNAIVTNKPYDKFVRDILTASKTIAVVGLSDNPDRPSYHVAAYLQRHGYRIIPVNPGAHEVLGERAYPSLREVPVPR